jgi:hypothetical protein
MGQEEPDEFLAGISRSANYGALCQVLLHKAKCVLRLD